MAVLAGCASSSGSLSSTSPSNSAVSAPGASETPSAASDQPAKATSGYWDPHSWKPRVETVAPTYSDEELASYYEERLVAAADERNQSPIPEVSLIRWSMGSNEYAANMATCLQEAGFPAVLEGRDYYFEPGVPAAQQDALNRASFVCNGQYMMHPIYGYGWTDEHVGVVYDYWVEYYIPCMRAHGHEVRDDDKPSREAYVNAFNTAQRIDWWPNEWSALLPKTERVEMEQICPQYPPDEVLFGQ